MSMRKAVSWALAGALLLPQTVAAQAPVVEYYHLDGLGSTRVVTDAAGAVRERHDYLPFGEECLTGPCASNPEAGAGEPKKFTGKERDPETGLDYFGARYYGAGLARFTTVDPVYTWAENLEDPQRWNRYAYVRNNPLRYADPDGQVLIPVIIVMAGAFVLNNVTRANVTEGPTHDTIVPNSVIVAGGYGLAAGGTRLAAKEVLEEVVENVTGLPVGGLPSRPRGVRANQAAGDAWSQAVGADLKATHEIAVPEITVRTESGARTRLDWVTRDGAEIGCVECKASATAPLTKAQRRTHPEMARTGAVVVGKGKPGIPGGTVIPPKPVEVRRPE